MKEFWKEIKGYEGLYQVSNYGRVKSLYWNNERIMKTAKGKDGYLLVQLWKNKKGKMYSVHRLVAQAFIPNPDNLPIINHKDEKPSNNHVENLEWCDYIYNNNYGTTKQRRADKQSKTVYQYNLKGEFVAEYPSTMEIQRQLGFNNGGIVACCNGKIKTAYGYKWTYK